MHAVLLSGFMLPGAQLDDRNAVLPQDYEPSVAKRCPYGYYNDGQQLSCLRCPLGATTEQEGAKSVNDCAVPPGYWIVMTGPNQGKLAKCPMNINGRGYYRTGWASPSQATSTTGDGTDVCAPCGSGIKSEYRDNDEIGDHRVIMDNDPFPGLVPATSASCCEFKVACSR
jgi:Tyrosine-protein kinase ephrin type A/B receptor-like